MPGKRRDPPPPRRALDPSARARAVVASLRAGEPSSAEVFEAFWQLDELPLDAVRDALEPWTGPLPDPDQLDPATRLAHGLPPPSLRLRTLSTTRDADVLDLGVVAEEQLRIAGTSWDGVDRPAEERLDDEVEGSFAGTLERRVVADANTPDEPLYDVLRFAEDSGIVFAAGTTTVVALIAYGKVELRDQRTRIALETALAGPEAVNAEPTADAPRPPKKRAPKKTTPEKTTPKKTVAKKVTSKKTVAKKVTAKKTAAKKTTPKKATSKKATSKTAAKKTSARKPASTTRGGSPARSKRS